MEVKVGDRVQANGYEGTTIKVCTGILSGMVEIRLPGGVSCQSIHGIKLINGSEAA